MAQKNFEKSLVAGKREEKVQGVSRAQARARAADGEARLEAVVWPCPWKYGQTIGVSSHALRQLQDGGERYGHS